MAKKDKFLVGLDIGSTKTCALIAEIDDEQLKFLALGAAESKGLRKGLIVNLDCDGEFHPARGRRGRKRRQRSGGIGARRRRRQPRSRRE